MGGKRKCDADGNVIPWPSDLKKRKKISRSRCDRPARENGTENAQRAEGRAAFNTDESVEQLKSLGLQHCHHCEVDLPVSAFPVAAPSSLKSVDGNGYLNCTECLDRDAEYRLSEGRTVYILDRSRMRSQSWKAHVKLLLKNKPGFDRYVLDNFDPKNPPKRNTLEEMKEKPVNHGMFDCFIIAVF